MADVEESRANRCVNALDTSGEDGNGGEKVGMDENNLGTMGLQDDEGGSVQRGTPVSKPHEKNASESDAGTSGMRSRRCGGCAQKPGVNGNVRCKCLGRKILNGCCFLCG